MGDNTRYGNPAEFEIDLHSIYAAYLWVQAHGRRADTPEETLTRRTLTGGTHHGEATFGRSMTSSGLAGRPWVRRHCVCEEGS
jgi:hypothetical protein